MAGTFISLGLPYKECAKAFQKEFIVMMLVAHEGNQCRAAKALGIHRNTLQRTMKALKIDVDLIRSDKLKAMGERPNAPGVGEVGPGFGVGIRG